jgi:hypothetical protein
MWKLNSDERLSRWRAFRKSLNSLTLEEAVASVANYWTSCPFTPYYLDPARPDTWPDPWTLVEENYWCDLAKALGMLYTIKLTVHTPTVEIRVYYDPVSKVNYNLVWIAQGKYVLNMSDGEVLNKTHVVYQLELQHAYDEEQLRLNSY